MSIKIPVYLPAMGIACSLGVGKESMAKSLFNNSTPHITEKVLCSGNTVPIFQVPGDLEPLPAGFQDLDSRNNRLLKLTLDEISDVVKNAQEKYAAHRIGVVLATSTSGMQEGTEAYAYYHQQGSWPKSYHYAQQEIASPSVFASRYLGIKGPSYTISTACSSGGKALCSAQRLIAADICDAVICGGVDTLCDLTLNGFDALELLSSTISVPFSKNRTGINIGEGATVFLLTKDQASIQFASGGESSDAYHISSPSPSGEGAEVAINTALVKAGIKPEEICYINLHGTGTQLNDAFESHCIYRLFQDRTPCSSIKAVTGHTLGASGAIEAALLWLCLSHEHQGTIPLPAHIWDGVQDLTLAPIRFTVFGERVQPINKVFYLMSNSFAFGGSNVSIILKSSVND